MSIKRKKFTPAVKPDRAYLMISAEIADKTRKQEREGFQEEMYVDAHRGISVQLGGPESDLKTEIDKSGIASFARDDNSPGSPNDVMYLKQAEHLMRKAAYKPALVYLDTALAINSGSKLVLATKAKCLLQMGNWVNALQAAEQVLQVDKRFVRAIFVKAESLYNTCNFEHALIFYHRGQRLSPDMEEFRLGIQKCRKTIRDGIRNEKVFEGEGIDAVFSLLRKATNIRSGDGKYTIRSLTKRNYSLNEEPGSMLKNMVKTLEEVSANRDKRRERKSITVQSSEETENSSKVGEVKQPQVYKRGAGPVAEAKMKIVQKRCHEKAKIALSGDRLLEDKLYLTTLASGICQKPGSIDRVKKRISNTAEEALKFLRAREEFWQQLKLGQIDDFKDKLSKDPVNSRFLLREMDEKDLPNLESLPPPVENRKMSEEITEDFFIS